MADLGKTFSKLGMKPMDVAKFVPEMTKYVGLNDGAGACEILGNLLK